MGWLIHVLWICRKFSRTILPTPNQRKTLQVLGNLWIIFWGEVGVEVVSGWEEGINHCSPKMDKYWVKGLK